MFAYIQNYKVNQKNKDSTWLLFFKSVVLQIVEPEIIKIWLKIVNKYILKIPLDDSKSKK